MGNTKRKPLLFLTNSLYGESNYETTIWTGAARQAEREGILMCALSGGQLVPGANGATSVPYLFRLAQNFDSDACVINAGTLQQGIAHDELVAFVARLPQRHKVATAIDIEGIPAIKVDNFAGMYAMIEHLVTDLGRRRIAYVSGPFANSEALDRLRAYKEVLTAHQIPVDEALIIEGTWNAPSGVEAVQRWISSGIAFDAVACANDLMAVAVLEELARQGVAVPSRVMVSGFDDIESAQFSQPSLSTVFQPIADLGANAVAAASAKVSGKVGGFQSLVPARMVLRSSAPDAAASAAEEINDQATTDSRDPWLNRLGRLKDRFSTEAWLGQVLDLVITAWTTPSETLAKDLSQVYRNQGHVDQAPFFRLLGALRAEMDVHLTTVDQWRRAMTSWQTLAESQRDHLIHQGFLNGKRSEAQVTALIAVNRALNQVSRISELEEAMVASFGRCGVQTCHVVLVEGFPGSAAQGRCIASLVDGKAAGAGKQPQKFPLSEILDGGLPSNRGLNWVLLPLSFEDQDLGYLVFEKRETAPFLYESLANVVAGILHSLLLIERIERAEALVAQRADRIGELVRPMIASLETTGAQARDQGALMASLVKANTETARRLSAMDRHVTGMQSALQSVVGLIGSIEEVSETISVIAINAAIAAARAGSDGKVFGVISAEIRKLSVQTKANTGQISEYLAELAESSQTFFEANTETRQTFSHLESEIRNLLNSLEGIQQAMVSMNSQAQKVLATMAESNQ